MSQEAARRRRNALDTIDEASVMAALALPRRGRVYSLASGWWHGMPTLPVHPNFDVLTYRSPRGFKNQRDQEFSCSRSTTPRTSASSAS